MLRLLRYVKKHWKGELSLCKAYWLNFFLVNMLIISVNFLLSHPEVPVNPIARVRASIIFLFITYGLVYPWQIVGLWRASTSHLKCCKQHLWAYVVRVLIGISLAVLSFNLWSSYRVHCENFRTAFLKDRLGEYSISLSPHKNFLVVNGYLVFNISKEIKDILKKNPQVQGIILNTPGGRIYEGRELAKIITMHKLDTYSTEYCFSAGTVAFIAGQKRYLQEGATLGFHQYTFLESSKNVDYKTEMMRDTDYFRSQGVSEDFCIKLLNTPIETIWYPTTDELIGAGVVQEIITDPNVLGE